MVVAAQRRHDDITVCGLLRSTTTERVDELTAELVTHAAVDDQVQRVTERYRHVYEQCRHLARLCVNHVHLERVLDDDYH